MFISVTGHVRLATDPELKKVGNNNASLVDFTIAVQRRGANKNGERKTEFIKCKAWNQTAELIAKYCAKGSPLIIRDSEIHIDNYTDKNGEPRTFFSLNVFLIDFVGSNKNSPAARGEEVKPANYLPSETSMGDFEEFEEVVGDDSLPF